MTSTVPLDHPKLRYRPVSPPLRVVLVLVGTVGLTLGIVARVVPGLPTTPFWLLAGWAWSRSSERLHTWLLTNRYVGPHVVILRTERAVTRRVKVGSTLMAWAALGMVAVLVVDSTTIRLVLLGVALAKTLAMALLPTAAPTATAATAATAAPAAPAAPTVDATANS